jgi:hypothetical protein
VAGKPTPKSQQAPAPEPAPDPLADLRDDGPEGLPPIAPEDDGTDLPEDGTEAEGVELRPMVSPDLWAEMVAEMVAAWHHDPTSQGFLHGGGQCGCFYIARHALAAAVPVAILDETEETVTVGGSSD